MRATRHLIHSRPSSTSLVHEHFFYRFSSHVQRSLTALNPPALPVVFASGETREEARKNLVMALKELFIMGEIRTTVEYLGELLETNEFKKNDIGAASPAHISCSC